MMMVVRLNQIEMSMVEVERTSIWDGTLRRIYYACIYSENLW